MSGDKITSEMLINYSMLLIVVAFGICAILLGYGKTKERWQRKQEEKRKREEEAKVIKHVYTPPPVDLKAKEKRARRRERNLYYKTKGAYGRQG